MKWNNIAILATALPLISSVVSRRLQAQTAAAPDSIQAAYAADAGKLSEKFAGLAVAMAGKYDWRPGQGVRSAGDVFNLIVIENGMLNGVLSGAATKPNAKPEPITDATKMQEALRTSYASLQQTIAGLSDSGLKTHVKLFGMDLTRQGAIMLLLSDQHEHLGQSIAYARMNGVVPPWSK